MHVAWFLTCRSAAGAADRSVVDVTALADIVQTVPGLRRGLIHTPAAAHDPYLDDGAGPDLVLELAFDDIAEAEAALAPSGALQALAAPGLLPGGRDGDTQQQAMLARSFPVPDPKFRSAADRPHCTYLVAYDGPAEDLNAWMTHYITSHPPIMARFPGIREIEICTRLDWCGALPFPRADKMQRNKVVFDDPASLDAALNSPVRHEMRADFARFPPFRGAITHFPMRTHAVVPDPR